MLRCCLATAFATAMFTATISLAQPELSAPPELGAQGMSNR